MNTAHVPGILPFEVGAIVIANHLHTDVVITRVSVGADIKFSIGVGPL